MKNIRAVATELRTKYLDAIDRTNRAKVDVVRAKIDEFPDPNTPMVNRAAVMTQAEAYEAQQRVGRREGEGASKWTSSGG